LQKLTSQVSDADARAPLSGNVRASERRALTTETSNTLRVRFVRKAKPRRDLVHHRTAARVAGFAASRSVAPPARVARIKQRLLRQRFGVHTLSFRVAP
jgi:hypothetical protein